MPTKRAYLPREFLPGTLAALFVLLSCSAPPSVQVSRRFVPPPRLEALPAYALGWALPHATGCIRGLRLLWDAPVPARPVLAATRSIVRSNPRLDPFEALLLASEARQRAEEAGLNADFFTATILQESAFDRGALSAAGAVGIAQFTLDTAEGEGVDPFDWHDALRGSAALLARYFTAYQDDYPDPYAVTLAAYNAGPGNVAYYHGVPPFAETRQYVADIYDRWSRLVRDETGAGYIRT